MLTPEEAWERIEPHLTKCDPVRLATAEASGRVLATGVTATVDVPPFDNAAMDGFALAGDLEPGAVLPIGPTIAAGDPPVVELSEAVAARIMTGAPLPKGASRVVPIENTEPDLERGTVGFPQGASGHSHVRRRAEVTARGGPLLPAGHRLTPGALGLLATHGWLEVDVHAQPSVASITTGDEVVPPGVEPGPGQIRDSHTAFFRGALAQSGLPLTALGIAPDRLDDLRELIGRGLEHDVLILSGGVSMGEFDLVEDVLSEHGCELLFDAVAIQPGKPVVAAVHDGGWVFALPGNPASAMVTYWLFVRPALRRMQGLDDRTWHGALTATLSTGAPPAKGRDRFLPGQARFVGGGIEVEVVVPEGSHDVAAYGRGNSLVRIPARSAPRVAGDRCEILPLGEWL